MKTTKIEIKEKATGMVQKTIIINGVPEDLGEIVKLTPETHAERAISFFMAGLEASAKARLEDGESVDYTDLLKRSGRRTQSGLIQSIMSLIPKAAMKRPELVGGLVQLQSDAMSDYKGHADSLYSRYQELYNKVEKPNETK